MTSSPSWKSGCYHFNRTIVLPVDYVQDVLMAMKSLGLNPAEQETIDMTNEVGSNGRVYFPDFCKIVLRKYRDDSKELLNQALFKVMGLITACYICK